MNIELFQFLIFLFILMLPGVLFFGKKLKKSENVFVILEKRFKVSPIVNIDTASPSPSLCLIHLDKIYHNDNIVNVGTCISIPNGQQQVYNMNMNQHYKFYNSYMERRWDMAIVIAGSLRTAWNGSLRNYYDLMITRCNQYKIDPPTSTWNGIYFKI